MLQSLLYEKIARSGWLAPVYIEFFAGAVFVVGIVGLALWRAVAYAMATGRRVPSGVRAGFWFGLGLVAGQSVADQVVSLSGFPRQPELLALEFVLGVGFCVWFTQSTHAWMRAWRHRATIPVFVLIHAAAVFVMTQWFASWEIMGVSFADANDATSYLASWGIGGPGATSLLHSWLGASDMTFYWNNVGAWTVLVVLLLPLLAWLIRPSVSRPGWVLRVTGGLSDSMSWRPLPSLRAAIVSGAVGGTASVVVIAVTMMYLHGRRSGSLSANLDLLSTYTLYAVAALMIGAVLAAGLACRIDTGHEVPAAFVSAEVSTIVGLIGWNMLFSVDGCIGRMNVLGASCVWRPRAAWGYVQSNVPELGATIIVASFAVAMVVSGFRSLRQPGTHDRPTTPTGPRRITGTRLMIATLIVLAGGIVPAAAANTDSGSAKNHSSDTLLSPSPESPPSAATRRQQVIAWLLVGGQSLWKRLSTDYADIDDYVGHQLAAGKTTISENKVLPYCNDIVSTVKDAENFFPVPDPAIQKAWRAWVTQLDTAARSCELAFDKGESVDSVLNQLDALNATFGAWKTFTSELDTAGALTK